MVVRDGLVPRLHARGPKLTGRTGKLIREGEPGPIFGWVAGGVIKIGISLGVNGGCGVSTGGWVTMGFFPLTAIAEFVGMVGNVEKRFTRGEISKIPRISRGFPLLKNVKHQGGNPKTPLLRPFRPCSRSRNSKAPHRRRLHWKSSPPADQSPISPFPGWILPFVFPTPHHLH